MRKINYTARLYKFPGTDPDKPALAPTGVDPRTTSETIITKFDRHEDIVSFLATRALKFFCATGTVETGPVPDALTIEIHSQEKIATPKAPWTAPNRK